jgi:TRAP-type C4-dicarboxylate transport system permease small subunit
MIESILDFIHKIVKLLIMLLVITIFVHFAVYVFSYFREPYSKYIEIDDIAILTLRLMQFISVVALLYIPFWVFITIQFPNKCRKHHASDVEIIFTILDKLIPSNKNR